jgi:hypothetical protein
VRREPRLKTGPAPTALHLATRPCGVAPGPATNAPPPVARQRSVVDAVDEAAAADDAGPPSAPLPPYTPGAANVLDRRRKVRPRARPGTPRVIDFDSDDDSDDEAAADDAGPDFYPPGAAGGSSDDDVTECHVADDDLAVAQSGDDFSSDYDSEGEELTVSKLRVGKRRRAPPQPRSKRKPQADAAARPKKKKPAVTDSKARIAAAAAASRERLGALRTSTAVAVDDFQGLPPTCGTLPESQEAVYNFQLLPWGGYRARPLRCVMCGRNGTQDSAEASAEIVLFVKHGKTTTCDGCMWLTYRLRDTTDGYFKWCTYCYRFKSLSTFSGKSRCDCCRKKLADAKRKRKRKADADEADADAPTA